MESDVDLGQVAGRVEDGKRDAEAFPWLSTMTTHVSIPMIRDASLGGRENPLRDISSAF